MRLTPPPAHPILPPFSRVLCFQTLPSLPLFCAPRLYSSARSLTFVHARMQVDWPAILSPRPTDFANEVYRRVCACRRGLFARESGSVHAAHLVLLALSSPACTSCPIYLRLPYRSGAFPRQLTLQSVGDKYCIRWLSGFTRRVLRRRCLTRRLMLPWCATLRARWCRPSTSCPSPPSS